MSLGIRSKLDDEPSPIRQVQIVRPGCECRICDTIVLSLKRGDFFSGRDNSTVRFTE